MKTYFAHAPSGNWSMGHLDDHIKYISWNAEQWSARVEGNTFTHAPGGDWSRAHTDSIINYVSWDGANWTARIVDGSSFWHVKYDGAAPHGDAGMNYYTWDHTHWTARLILRDLEAKTSCTNLSGETIWLKLEKSGTTIPLAPGEVYTQPFDGLCYPSERLVFKVVDRVSAVAEPGGRVVTSPRDTASALGQLFIGGRLREPPDVYWRELFDRCR